MSKSYSTSNQSFFQNQSRVRKLIQTELQQFFSCIKDEIEGKIKSMDKTIREIKSEIKVILEKQNYCIQKIDDIGEGGRGRGGSGGGKEQKQNWGDFQRVLMGVVRKLEEFQKQREKDVSRIWEELRARPTERNREKSPLFRKSNGPTIDLNNIIFGEQNLKNSSNSQVIREKVQPEQKQMIVSKPPLPKQKPQQQQKPFKKPQFSPTQAPEQPQILDPESIHPPSLQHLKQKQVSILSPLTAFSTVTNQSSTESSKNSQEENVPSKVIENLNKNKNSFMRKKSLKKFGTILEEDVEESMLSTQ